MSRLRAVVALCAVLSLLAPAVAVAGIEIHLQWGSHHADHSHRGPHEHPAPVHGVPTCGFDLPGSHSHAAPDLEPDPATLRETRPSSGDSDRRLGPPLEPSAVAGVPEFESRAPRSRPPDAGPRSPSPPALIHLHCALLL